MKRGAYDNTYNLQIEDNATATAECLIREHECATACEGEHVWFMVSPPLGQDTEWRYMMVLLLSPKDIEIQLPHRKIYHRRTTTNQKSFKN